MGESNLDKLSAQTVDASVGFNGSINSVNLAVDTVSATALGDLPVANVATGDAVLGAYTGGGGYVTPGTITSGHVASDATSGDSVIVIWADQS